MDDHDTFKDPKIVNSKYWKYNWIPEPNRYLNLSVTNEESGYRPVTNSILAVMYHFFGGDVKKYHVVSLIGWVLVGWLVYVFVLRFSGDLLWAFLSALLFTIHPINGLVVNYVVASAYVYQMILTLAVLILFQESLRRRCFGLWGVWSVVLFIVSLGVHETSIILPIFILLLALSHQRQALKQRIFFVFPYFFILGGYLIFRIKFASLHSGVFAKFVDFQMTGLEYLATWFKIMAWYGSQLMAPDGVVLMWSTPIIRGVSVWPWIIVGGIVILFMVYGYKRWTPSLMAWGMAIFGASMIPILAACLFRPTTGLVMEPHWMVLGSLGVFVLLAGVLVRLVRWNSRIGIVLCALLVAGYIRLSHVYNELWKDEKTYCHYWLIQAPAFKTTEFFLAYAYQEDRQYDLARYYLLRAREGVFSDWQIYSNLGVMAYDEGQYDSAYDYYQKALRIHPQSAEVYNNLALVYEQKGQVQEAIEANQQAVFLNRMMIEPRLNLARIALANNQWNQAVSHYRDNLAIIPFERRTTSLLFETFMRQKNPSQAKILIDDVMRSCRDVQVFLDVAKLSADYGQALWAIDLYMKALQIDPGFVETYIQSGILLARLGQNERAVDLWRKALTMDPKNVSIQKMIQQYK